MSSSSSVRRMKERGGAGGKVTALKPQKTLTENRQKEILGSCKKPFGKENPRALSGARTPSMCQKPALRPLPVQRTEKVAAAVSAPGKDGESRVRWSTSSFPKGKSSNPSDSSRLIPDLRGDRLARVSGSDRSLKTSGRASVGEIEVSDGVNYTNSFRILQKCHLKKSNSSSNSKGQDEKSDNCSTGLENCKDLGLNSKEVAGNGVRVLEDCKEQFLPVSGLERNGGKRPNGSGEKDVLGAMNIVENSKLHVDLYGMYEKALNGIGVVNNCKENTYLDSGLQGSGENDCNGAMIAENSRDTVHDDLHLIGRDGFGVSGNSKGEDVGEESKGGQVVNKYPSKLHEKLAYLEGKVKRIASDIKRTKEMLDMNDPDSSKLILLDIQDKISGIEKAMGKVVDDGKGKLGSNDIVENDKLQSKCTENNQDGLAGNLKKSVKILNHEELEARLFPHHKLIRSRASFDNSARKDQSLKPNFLEGNGDSVQEEGSLRSIDENPIALEFLASLEKKHPKINSDSRYGQLDCTAIQEMDAERTAKPEGEDASKKVVSRMHDEDLRLTADENLEDFDDQENKSFMIVREETEDSSADQLREIGRKSSTGGWFVSEGESVLLAHDDSSCSFHDVTNSEEKSEYKPPAGVSHNLWGDCWLIRAADSDGCSGRYVVAASAGNTLDSGFCSWDFYTKDIRAFRVENGTTTSRTVLGPLPNRAAYRRDTLTTTLDPGNQQWWYKPCGPLLVSTASCQKVVSIYDIRDGDLVMKWEVQRPVLTMDYSSPLQWRNKGKVVIAEAEAISVWDVNSLNPKSLLSIASFGKKVYALHVNNTEAELGGGVRRRVSSSEAEGNDGVFCTQDTINVLDFRLPSGVGLKITNHGVNSHSIFSHRDSIFIGSTDAISSAGERSRSLVQHFSLRKGNLVGTYALPESNSHFHHSTITQVWGDSNLVMAICGLGLFVFDKFNDEAQPFSICHGSAGEVREVIGPDDLYCPSFDYFGSRALLISRDRPALWKFLS